VCYGSFLFSGTETWFALQDLCDVADHFCSLEQNLVCFARYFCVVDHFDSLKQWVGVCLFLQTFVVMGPNHNTIWFCREDGGVQMMVLYALVDHIWSCDLGTLCFLCYKHKHKIVFGQKNLFFEKELVQNFMLRC
jgi:hypothetical protein